MLEPLFDLLLRLILVSAIWLIFSISTRFQKFLEEEKETVEAYKRMNQSLRSDFEILEEKIFKVTLQLNALPDVIKEDNFKLLEGLRKALDTEPKPMKSNNWDSINKAFSGPVRKDLHERD